MIDKFYPYRFELFLFTQLSILFGSLIIPSLWFDNYVMPVLLLCNLISGVLLVSNKKRLTRFMLIILFISVIIVVVDFMNSEPLNKFNYFKLSTYFIFYAITTIEIIKQVWNSRIIEKNVILGLISGYISLGLLAFFLCITIEIVYPQSFSGLTITEGLDAISTDRLMYFSYITLMTIGYGDILPLTPIAQKAAVFIGLIGQFYLVILTAIVVGKYINQNNEKNYEEN